jgi:class 3 adenylate cyclase
MKVCSACGEQNPDKAKFCLECATPLADASAPGRRERRVVSAVFCDLVGFTSRSERADIEEVEQFLHGYHALLRRELERHGGTVEKFIGDAVMALFGAPVAHEDDAERAVRAALAIQDSVLQLRERDGVDVHVRVGVTTGEALVSLGANPAAGEGMASGDVVNTAARLQSAAPVDGVLVDEATYRATDRVIRHQQADAVTAKGKADPVQVWQAVEPRSLLPEQARMSDLDLVGREAELGHLVGALERSGHEPSTQLVTVIGSPGIGKSRLVEELGVHVEAQPALIRWRRGRSLAYGEGVAFWALGEMVKAEAGILESDPVELTEQKLHDAVGSVIVDERDREWAMRHLRPLVGLEGETSIGTEGGRAEGFAAWRRFFEALAEDGPTVLVFEDLHWGDDALLDFIDLLAERAGAVPLLIVCTARPELLERRAGWGGGKTNSQTILLSPLSEADTARLVGELLDQGLLPAETQQALLERAGGNPLYAQEYVRMLRDRGLLVRDGGGWRLAGVPEGLPESVHAIIAARLDTLGEEERRLIQDASVIGRVAWLGAVSAISETSAWNADELLHGLERKQLLRRARRSSVAGEVEFTFAHAVTQEVAYGQIRRPERAEKHERAAAWIEGLSGDREDKAELLAHHYLTALNLRTQAGDEPGPTADRARAALAEAGHRAQAVYAHASAARYLKAALELTDSADPTRARLVLEQATASYEAGSADESLLRTALQGQETAGDWEGAARACMILSDWLQVYAGDSAEAEELEARGYDYATRERYTPLASRFASYQAWRLLVNNRASQVLPFTADAMRRADEIEDTAGRALLSAWHGWARVETGDPSGLDEMRAAAATLDEQNPQRASMAFHNLGETLIGLGDLVGAAEAHRDAARASKRFGNAYDVGSDEAVLAADAYSAGNWTLAFEVSTRLVEHPAAYVVAEARWVRGRIALARGDCHLAEEDGHWLERGSDASPEAIYGGLALIALAKRALGDHDGADKARRSFLDRWTDAGAASHLTPALAELARAGVPPEALREAASLLPDSSRWKPALLAIAGASHAEAASIFAEIGSLPLEAAACLQAAEAAAGFREAEAADHAQRALSFFRHVEATAYIADAEALLARARSA